MKKIALNQGQFAIIDDEYFEELNQFKWRVTKERNSFYAIRTYSINGKKYTIKMHRYILKLTDPKIHVDHINHNGLDNRLENLRACNRHEYKRNRSKLKNNTSGFKGVYWNKRRKKYTAYIYDTGNLKYLGSYLCPIEAAKAYNKAAIKYYGEFAQLNEL
ncbi:MAG: Fis family transcriptional regulator [Caulobacteraceae bacterium]|nr:Fis family transcriptional regulator [Caulobacteraceae bacterium]